MLRSVRIGILLFVLLAVAQGAWIARGRTTDWKEPLRVVIYRRLMVRIAATIPNAAR